MLVQDDLSRENPPTTFLDQVLVAWKTAKAMATPTIRT